MSWADGPGPGTEVWYSYLLVRTPPGAITMTDSRRECRRAPQAGPRFAAAELGGEPEGFGGFWAFEDGGGGP